MSVDITRRLRNWAGLAATHLPSIPGVTLAREAADTIDAERALTDDAAVVIADLIEDFIAARASADAWMARYLKARQS
jgi:hypothetical protein